MSYQIQSPAVGFANINWGYAPDATQRCPLGLVVYAVDNFWGGGSFIYGKNNSGSAQVTGTMCVWDQSYNFVAIPNAANQARACAAAWSNFSTTGAFFGWYQFSGQVPLVTTVSVATTVPMGITGVGTLGASSAGKEIEGLVSGLVPATTVVIANCNTQNGSPILQVGKSDGWFPGVTLSGTGIPGSTTITGFDPSGRFVTMSNNATATGTASITGTYTGFNVGISAGGMVAQGRIT